MDLQGTLDSIKRLSLKLAVAESRLTDLIKEHAVLSAAAEKGYGTADLVQLQAMVAEKHASLSTLLTTAEKALNDITLP